MGPGAPLALALPRLLLLLLLPRLLRLVCEAATALAEAAARAAATETPSRMDELMAPLWRPQPLKAMVKLLKSKSRESHAASGALGALLSVTSRSFEPVVAKAICAFGALQPLVEQMASLDFGAAGRAAHLVAIAIRYSLQAIGSATRAAIVGAAADAAWCLPHTLQLGVQRH